MANKSVGFDIEDVGNYVPPEQITIWIKTWGCSHNISDGEYMSGLLSSYGYNIIFNENKSDSASLWILNSCTVKGPSEAHFLTLIRKAKNKNKYIVAAGCVPQGDKKINELNNISIIGVQQIDRIIEVVQETLKGNIVRLFGSKRIRDETGQRKKRRDGGAKLNLPKIRKNPLIEIIAINTGCLNQCTYCKTKHARGDLASYSIKEIIDRIKYILNNELLICEIWLTSEDTGAYGLDINTNISKLLIEICNIKFNRNIMFRLGMTNPPYIKDHLQIIANTLNHPNFYSFLHIPVQSGSNSVLNAMKRKYTINDFINVCDYLIDKVPRIHISTDFICGFPNETDNDHRKSMDILNKYKFTTLNISQFYPRPKTMAAKMKKLDTKIVKKRSREMTKLFKSYISFTERIGEKHNVLITEIAKDGYHLVGHNKAYDHFLVPPNSHFDLMGKIVCVEIVQVGKYYIKSKIINYSNKYTMVVTNGLNNNNTPNISNKYNDRNNWVYCLSLFTTLIIIVFASHSLK